MDSARGFYRDVLGMEVVFETLISGEPFDAVLHASFSVTDLDNTPRRITEAGHIPDQVPFEIGGVRMFFVKDPDGTPVEPIELPVGARSTYEMHRRVKLHIGPA
jgi:catechol 2,3-dioxygenase-like lactoylglutathione lyase family enzyme